MRSPLVLLLTHHVLEACASHACNTRSEHGHPMHIKGYHHETEKSSRVYGTDAHTFNAIYKSIWALKKRPGARRA